MAVDRGINVLNVLLAASLIGASQAYLKAGCKIETLRACGNDYTPYANGPHLHESGQEFYEGCKRDRVQVPCTLKFIKDCTEGVARAAALVAVKALEENIEAICVVGSEPYKNYQRGIKCMNSHGDKMHKCMQSFHDILEQAVVKGPSSEVLHYTCCAYHELLDCVYKTLTPCESVGSKDLMIDVLNQVFGETLNLVCGRYTKGSSACQALPPLPQLGPQDRKIANYVELLLEASSARGRKN